MICYWLLKRVINYKEYYEKEGDVLGIVSFPNNTFVCDKIDNALGLNRPKWCWVGISQAEFETYQAFGFKEYILNEN